MALRFFVLGMLAVLATSTALSAENGNPGDVSAASATAPPVLPTFVLGASTIPADTTTTLTWDSPDAVFCTAGGNANALQTGWHGRLAISGTYSVTPISVGTFSYTVYCTNTVGNSPTASATLTVTPSPYSGGVGAFDPWSLLALAVCVALLRRVRRSAAGMPPAA